MRRSPSTQIIKVANLVPGQEVAVANCRDPGVVVAREAKNRYRVRYQGREISMPRSLLGVMQNGQWRFGPVSTNG